MKNGILVHARSVLIPSLRQAHMMLGPLEASLLGILSKSIGAKNILEIGSFTGFDCIEYTQFASTIFS